MDPVLVKGSLRQAIRGIVPALAAVSIGSSPLPSPPPELPVWATLQAESSFIRKLPDAKSPAIGILRSGDNVIVQECLPSCTDPAAWVRLLGDGYVRNSLLKRIETPPPQPEGFLHLPYWYGRVIRKDTVFRDRPDDAAKETGRVTIDTMIAIFPDDALYEKGWLRRIDGTYVRSSQVARIEPYPFSGVPDPELPIAFTLRKVKRPTDELLERHVHLPVLGTDVKGNIVTASGSLPRSAVRLAVQRDRPAGVSAGGKWVHVDLREQTLVAYEGDRPVLATLVSSGKDRTPTPEGLFLVWQKARHEPMSGLEDDPYLVEEVPDILFFSEGIALHGAFWHSQFGTQVSHGCVNLSVKDARWLFGWSPPDLPVGWHSIIPDLAGRPSLPVLVERAPPVKLPRFQPRTDDDSDARN